MPPCIAAEATLGRGMRSGIWLAGLPMELTHSFVLYFSLYTCVMHAYDNNARFINVTGSYWL